MSRSGFSKPLRKSAASPRKHASVLDTTNARRRNLEEAIASIQRDDDWPRIVELYYWSREPGMLDLIRMLIAMPERTRAALEAFCAMAHEPGSIVGDLDGTGRLTLTSVDVGQAAAIIGHSTDEDDVVPPLRLN